MCTCVSDFNAKLADHNAALVTTMFGKPKRVCIETYKVDAKKRGFRPPKAMASFCPFCGEKYVSEAPSIGEIERRMGVA